MSQRMKRARLPIPRQALHSLEQLPNVGPSLAKSLRAVGVQRPRDLPGKDAYALYETLCEVSGARQDPCVLDVFISAVKFMEGAPPHPWWHYTAERKRALAASR
jgi:pathogenicity locus Cdd1 protein